MATLLFISYSISPAHTLLTFDPCFFAKFATCSGPSWRFSCWMCPQTNKRMQEELTLSCLYVAHFFPLIPASLFALSCLVCLYCKTHTPSLCSLSSSVVSSLSSCSLGLPLFLSFHVLNYAPISLAPQGSSVPGRTLYKDTSTRLIHKHTHTH